MSEIPTREEVFGRAVAQPLAAHRFDVDDSRRVTPQPLTDTQARVLRFIARHILHWQRPPTQQGMAAEFGWSSVNAATHHLLALERKGWIAMDHVSSGGRGKSLPRVLHWPDDTACAIARASTGEAQAADSPVQGDAGRVHDQSRSSFNR